MTHGSLFSGIGGFDLAAQWMGWDNVFHCEYDEFNQKILQYYWPYAKKYKDIKTTNFIRWRGKIDVLSGGFPCQPFSTAGKRKGDEDDRHLWPQMLRAIKEIKPIYIVGENVHGLLNWSDGLVFEQVCSQMESEGYQVETVILPACGVNAPHQRKRVWIVAYSEQARLERMHQTWRTNNREGRSEEIRGTVARCYKKDIHWNAANTMLSRGGQDNWARESRLIDQTGSENNWENFPTQSPLCGRNDGIPSKLDNITIPKWRRKSIMAYGNAIVPQLAYKIFKSIEETHKKL